MSSLEMPTTESLEPDDRGADHAKESPRKVSVDASALTDTGKVRKRNEDHYLVARMTKSLVVCQTSLSDCERDQIADREGYLLIVADGMGGVAGGQEASALAVESVERFVLDRLKWFLQFEGCEEHTLFSELRQSLERADQDIIERAHQEPRLHGMGTTMTMAYSVGTCLYIVHAGDSRAYLYRDGELEQITSDHTLVQILVEGGLITPEDARTHRKRHVVTNVLGGPQEGVHAEIHKVEVMDGDLLLLCTDGLVEPLGNEAIQSILERHPTHSASDLCTELVGQALEHGGPDNVTTIVARYRVEPS